MMENSLVVLKKKSLIDKIINIILVVITILAITILLLCSIIITQKIIFPNKVPSLFGIKPFIVLTDSMNPTIKSGDLALVKNVKTNSLKKGDIIAFRNTKDNSVTLHRIIRIETNENQIIFKTKGDNNKSEDKHSITSEYIEGIFFKKINHLGNVSMFIRSPEGVICSSLVIVTIFLTLRIIKIRKQKKELEKKIQEYKDILQELWKE